MLVQLFKRTSGSSARSALAVASLLSAGLLLGAAGRANAATIYYDTNGGTLGTGTGTLDWNSSATAWNFDATGGTNVTNTTGGAGTQAWASSGTNNLNGSDVVFSASDPSNLPPASYSINNGGNKVANSITVASGAITLRFASSSGTSANRTIGAGGITLSAPDPSGVTPPTPLAFVGPTTAGNFNVILSASQTWTNNSGATNAVTFLPAATPGSGVLTLGGSAATGDTYTLTLTGSAAGAYTFGIGVSDGAAGGQLAISTDKNTNFLNAVSTYSGGTTITAGTTLLDNGGGLGHANLHITGGTLAGGTTGAGGSLTDNIANDTGELISLAGSGTLDLTNLNLNLAVTGTQTQAEYVLANAGVGSSNVLGTSFASVTGLPSGWSIAYSGTAANPGDIVLVNGNVQVPEPASIGLLGLGVLGLVRRRRH